MQTKNYFDVVPDVHTVTVNMGLWKEEIEQLERLGALGARRVSESVASSSVADPRDLLLKVGPAAAAAEVAQPVATRPSSSPSQKSAASRPTITSCASAKRAAPCPLSDRSAKKIKVAKDSDIGATSMAPPRTNQRGSPASVPSPSAAAAAAASSVEIVVEEELLAPADSGCLILKIVSGAGDARKFNGVPLAQEGVPKHQAPSQTPTHTGPAMWLWYVDCR